MVRLQVDGLKSMICRYLFIRRKRNQSGTSSCMQFVYTTNVRWLCKILLGAFSNHQDTGSYGPITEARNKLFTHKTKTLLRMLV